MRFGNAIEPPSAKVNHAEKSKALVYSQIEPKSPLTRRIFFLGDLGGLAVQSHFRPTGIWAIVRTTVWRLWEFLTVCFPCVGLAPTRQTHRPFYAAPIV